MCYRLIQRFLGNIFQAVVRGIGNRLVMFLAPDSVYDSRNTLDLRGRVFHLRGCFLSFGKSFVHPLIPIPAVGRVLGFGELAQCHCLVIITQRVIGLIRNRFVCCFKGGLEVLVLNVGFGIIHIGVGGTTTGQKPYK